MIPAWKTLDSRSATKYNAEKKKIEDAIKNLQNNVQQNHEISVNLFKVSQTAADKYAKLLPEKKRELAKLIFEEFSLNYGKVSYVYTKPFMAIFSLITHLNCTNFEFFDRLFSEKFEPKEKVDLTSQIDSFYPHYLVLLPD